MKNIINNKTILIITSLFFGCLVIIPLFDIRAADLEKRKNTIDPVLEAKFLIIERGKIPIGECVDEAEDLAQKIMDQMDIIDENLEKEISAGDELVWLPEDCKCANCKTKCEEECDKKCLENCKGKDCNCACCTYECANCSGDVCPFDEIEEKVDAIQEADDKIQEAGQKIKDLVEAENLTKCDPDRWKILNKLRNSRYKMEECVRGFESALKHPRVEVNFLSCRAAMDEIESGGLVLLGYFENNISDYPFCYPYTANTDIREICKTNRDSDDCHIPTKPYMDNYFCAGFVGPTGELGGNKEGDEAPVCDGTEIPDDPDDVITDKICMNYSKILAGPNFRDTYCSDENCQNEYSIGDVKWSCDAQGNNCVDMTDDDTWLLSKDCCKHFYKGKNIVDVIYQSIPSEDNRKIIWECITD